MHNPIIQVNVIMVGELLVLVLPGLVGGLDIYNPYKRDLGSLLKEPPLRNWRSDDPIRGLHADDVEELWLEQRLDHQQEGSVDKRLWQMRYLRNRRHFLAGGPMFIFVGGEWSISAGYLLAGHMFDMARQHSGMMFYTEHRFYGQSWPFDSTSSENLIYLSAQQALADLHHFIRYQKETVAGLNSSSVVLVGGSYAGSLATWYTHIYRNDRRTVAWASSAPINAKLDFHEYMQLTGEAITEKTGGAECHQRIQRGLAAVRRILIEETFTKAASIMEDLKICNTFNVDDEFDVAAFFHGINNYFAAAVQTYSNRIPAMCEELLSQQQHGADVEEDFLEFIKFIFWPRGRHAFGDDWCLDLSFRGMSSLFDDIHDKTSAARQWLYQSCSQFGWFTTASLNWIGAPSPIQVPLKYFQRLCVEAFKASTTSSSGHQQPTTTTTTTLATVSFTVANMNASVAKTNKLFNSNQQLANSHLPVYFTHGSLDPWRALGQRMVNKNVITIPDYSHCDDLASIDFRDSVEMNLAKLKVASFVTRFIFGFSTASTTILNKSQLSDDCQID